MSGVHVIPIGLERDRLYAGLKKHPANHVILLRGRKLNRWERISRENAEAVRKKIASPVLRVEYREADFLDFEGAFRDLNRLFHELSMGGTTVYFNASTGPRIVSFAGILACFLYSGVPYLTIPRKYHLPRDLKVLSEGVAFTQTLPSVRFTEPDPTERLVLQALFKVGGSVEMQKDFVPLLRGTGFVVEDKKTEGAVEGAIRAKVSRVLRLMRERGYIRTERGKAGGDAVHITEAGKLFCT